MKSDELLKITYKNQAYSLKELIEAERSFAKVLIVPERLNILASKSRWALLGDYGYMIAGDKFRQLYSLLSTARFALTQAHQKIHKSPVLWSSGYGGQLWLRSQYLKNSILWYNSCDDYVLQIIWFAFDFFEHQKLSSAKRYKAELKSCRWESLFKTLQPRETEPAVNLLKEKIDLFRENVKIRELREIANSLKHHASLHIKDLEDPESILITSQSGFRSDAVESQELDVDDCCELLKEVHLIVVEFAEFLYSYVDFDLAFKKDHDGTILLDESPTKSDYKKFFINP